MRKNRWMLIFTIAYILILNACASKPVTPEGPIETKAVRLEKRAQADTLKQDYVNASKAAHDALRLYALLDDQEGQLRSHLNLTRLFLLQNLRDNAKRHLAKAHALEQEINTPLQRYQVHLLTAKLNNDPDEFKRARDAANTPLEQAVAETYLKNYQQARILIDTVQATSVIEEDDSAFVLLHYARYAADENSADEALTLYKKNENTLGISDTLYVLAMIAKKQGDDKLSTHYLRRALEVNLVIGDKQRIAATLKALDK